MASLADSPVPASHGAPTAVERPELSMACSCGPGCSCGCQSGGPCQCGGGC
ncbi:hypothetical protein ACWD6P_07275 [Streptomyces sp. NPDC002446]